jgi:hypothetical protein
LQWHESVGNGFKEDDCSSPGFRSRDGVHRFTRDGCSAYAWQEGEGWVVQLWHPLRESSEPRLVAVPSSRAALDLLMGGG